MEILILNAIRPAGSKGSASRIYIPGKTIKVTTSLKDFGKEGNCDKIPLHPGDIIEAEIKIDGFSYKEAKVIPFRFYLHNVRLIKK